MKQRLSFRRGFFVGLVGVSFGLALASGLLAVLERRGVRQTMNDSLVRFANTDALVAQDKAKARRFDTDAERALTAAYNPAIYSDNRAHEAFGSEVPRLLPDTAQLLIPEITSPVAGDLAARLDGEELALADMEAGLGLDGSAQQASTIAALLQTLEPTTAVSASALDSDQGLVQVAQSSGMVSAAGFVSTASLKTLPSGRVMSWVTPGLAMTEQHNPLYLDQRGYCALTFDDGPDRIKDNRIMDILRAEGVPATFFVLGNKLKGAEATIARMLAEGHEVGNHSWSHPQLTKLGADKARSQVERTSRALEKLGAIVRVFRPPYGDQNQRVRGISQDLGMRTLLWDVDSLDWKVRRGESIRAEIDNTADRGSVILMHSHVNGTVEALPQIIADLRAKGCTFVTASQWFDGLNSYGQPLPQQRARAARTPKAKPSSPAVVAPSVPTTSYQWDPNPVPSYPVTPSQPAAGEPIYIY